MIKSYVNKALLVVVAIHDVGYGMQYYSAITSGCTYIVTENKEDYYFSEIKVVSFKEFLKNE